MPAEINKSQINQVYRERNQVIATLSKVFPAHLTLHADSEWEDDFRTIVCIHVPTGQVTWHIHDSDLNLFDHLILEIGDHYDGHTTEQKYARLAAIPDISDVLLELVTDAVVNKRFG